MTTSKNRLISLILTMMLVAGFFVPSYAEDEVTTDSGEGIVTELRGESESEPEGEPAGGTVEEPEPEEPEVCTEHVWGNWVVTAEPTYTSEGSRTRTCGNCGEAETESIAKLVCTDHAWGSWNEVTPATYTAAGSRTRTCANCGAVQQETIPMLKCTAHSWAAWTVTKKATYFATGSRTHKCTKCGIGETQVVPKLTAYKKWVAVDGKRYYLNNKSLPVKGWQKIKSGNAKKAAVKWCYFNKKGVFIKAISKNTKKKWVTADGKRFWFTAKKKPAGPGFNTIKGKLYYMDADGAMVKGTFKASDGVTYTTSASGYITGLEYYKRKYKTFVLVDISDQTIKFYKNGKLKRSGNVVTGLKNKMDTPTGMYKIRSKARNIYLTGPTWNVFVKYWMAFIGSSYGLHDAPWWSDADFRNKRTYVYSGSHGCINMRPSDAKYLYNNAPVGTKVIVQK